MNPTRGFPTLPCNDVVKFPWEYSVGDNEPIVLEAANGCGIRFRIPLKTHPSISIDLPPRASAILGVDIPAKIILSTILT